MTMPETVARPPASERNPRVTAAVVLLAIQSALLVLAGLALWIMGADGRRRFARRFLHEQLAAHPMRWGLLLLIVGAALVTAAIGIAHRRGWAAVMVYIVEPIVALGSLLRFHPLRSVIGIGLAVAVIVLVATTAAPRDRFADP